MNKAKLLIVDDDFHCRTIIATALSRFPFEITHAENGEEAIHFMETQAFDLVMSDMMMPKVDGMGVLDFFRQKNFPDSHFILMTAFGTIEKAVEAMKKGAYDFLVKPVNLKQLEVIVQKALDNSLLKKQNRTMREELREKGSPSIIGHSNRIKEILILADKVAQNDSTVLITGPSGTGKELIARRIHYGSPRLGSPFITVNCAAIPTTLMESQLFGHMRGSFTGAEADHLGLFQQAEGGTLFLDEVGDLDLNMQVKLFRAIQEREVRPIGGNKVYRVNIRLITATNKHLLEEVKNGTFREDLYYRLNVVNIELPPLCKRVEDIPDLVHHFVRKYNPILNKDITSVSENFLRTLCNYDFPGNIRELENMVQKAMILSEGSELDGNILTKKGGSFSNGEDGGDMNGGGLHELVEQLEKETITKALRMFNANHSRVAKYLKIPRSTLYKKLNDYHIDVKKL